MFTFEDVILSKEELLAYNFGIYHGVFVCIHLSSVLLCSQDSYMPPFPNTVCAYNVFWRGKGELKKVSYHVRG